jgi:uncharacterized protein (TIGR02270 family)
LEELGQYDARMQHLLDALLLDGKEAFVIAKQELATNDRYGQVFGCFLLAIHLGDAATQARILDKYGDQVEWHRDLVGALVWSGRPPLQDIAALQANLSARDQWLLLSAAAALRHDPGNHLLPWLAHKMPELRRRALRVSGELARLDLRDQLTQAMRGDPDELCRAWAAWSLALQGSNAEANQFMAQRLRVVWPYSALEWRGLELLMARLFPDEARALLAELRTDSNRIRAVVKAAGWSGDPGHLPWLVEQIADPATAQTAAASIYLITGIKLADQGVATLDAKTDRATRDAIDGTTESWHPLFDFEAASTWWSTGPFKSPSTLAKLGGGDRNTIQCAHVLLTGTQPLRASAALNLSLRRKGMPLFPVYGPVYAQMQFWRTGPAFSALIEEVEEFAARSRSSNWATA